MNDKQMNAAMRDMTGWLAHPQELGKEPAKIECAGEFDYLDMHYYIFKYKRNVLGKWLIGVCGGYEDDSTEHCGHLFSDMEEYRESEAKEQAIALIEKVRRFWMEAAEKAEERKERPGTFLNFVLLEEAKWDKEALLEDLKENWGIEDEPDHECECGCGHSDCNCEAEHSVCSCGEDESDITEDDETFVISYKGAMIAVSLMPAPIPAGEAEGAALNNFMWKDGAEQVKKHHAHLMIAVMGMNLSPVESGEMLVKVTASACRQEGVIGVYANETVYPADYYIKFSGMIDDGLFPLYNLVWFGLYNGKGGLCGYTAGMSAFGYDEIEVLDSGRQPSELYDFLADIANYVITQGAVLKDGETIGFSAEQKLPITRSEGAAVEGYSLKIEF